MSMLETLDVSGKLLAVSPIAVSPPGAAFSSDDKGAPQRLPSVGKNRYLPASTFRHVLRYGTIRVVQEAMKAQGKSLSLDALLMLDKGFFAQRKKDKGTLPGRSNGKMKAKDVLRMEQEVREKNPLLGLFGVWTIPSMLRVRNAFPIPNAQGQTYTVASGLVRKALEEDLVDALTKQDAEDYLQRLDDWSEADKETTGLKHISERPWEEIVAGVECEWGYQIHRFTPFQSGAVLAGLRYFASDPVIGAHKAVGRGELAMELNASVIRQDILNGPQSAEAGTLTLRRGEFRVDGLLAEHLSEFDRLAKAGFPGMDFHCLPALVEGE